MYICHHICMDRFILIFACTGFCCNSVQVRHHASIKLIYSYSQKIRPKNYGDPKLTIINRCTWMTVGVCYLYSHMDSIGYQQKNEFNFKKINFIITQVYQVFQVQQPGCVPGAFLAPGQNRKNKNK